MLDTNLDGAEKLLTQARRESGTDAELRFCATYNLGWVAVRRADKILQENPEQALVHLRTAADWFQDAVAAAHHKLRDYAGGHLGSL